MLTSRVVVFVVLFGLAACNETRHANYASYSDAQQSGAIERGWIPDYVPSSAVDLVEAHDLDINTQRLRFRLPDADLQTLTLGLERVPVTEVWPPRIRSPELKGDWPSELSQFRHTPRSSFRTYRVRRTTSGLRCVAVDAATHTVYAWSCDAPAS